MKGLKLLIALKMISSGKSMPVGSVLTTDSTPQK